MSGRVLLCVLLLAACSRRDEVGPPRIVYGEDPCAYCKMIVSEERFAAGAVVQQPGGRPEAVPFDDIGCLLAYLRAHRDAVKRAYVKDFETRRWLRAEEAVYLKSERLTTPMASGLAAFASQAAARAATGHYPGAIRTWAELRGKE